MSTAAGTKPELTYEQMQSTLANIDIPPCPAIVTQVMAESQKDEPDIKLLTQLIAADVSMSAFALKMANSPLFRRGDQTDSVAQAVARLGTRNIICIVVATALRANLASGLPESLLENYWRQAGNTAMAAGMIARRLRGIPADLAYTYGLFHDAAIPVMMRRFGDYQETYDTAADSHRPLPEVENERYHCTHAVVGALLARNWGLQKSLSDAIRYHHDADVYSARGAHLDGDTLNLIACVHVAEHVLAELSQTACLDCDGLFKEAIDYLGLHEDDMRDLAEDLAGAIS